MKKLFSVFMISSMILTLAACGNSAGTGEETGVASQPVSTEQETNTPEETGEQSEPQETLEVAEPEGTAPEESEGKVLVIYFSATGNTRTVAETLANLQNADIYEIVPEQPYTDDDLNYNDRSTRATAEQNDDSARPAIAGTIDNLDSYDVIYIGYPIWWGDMPRILYTFFDTYDLSGKTIAPFCTSGGSGLSGTPGDIADLEPDATVLDGLHVNDSSISGAESSLADWISSIGLAE